MMAGRKASSRVQPLDFRHANYSLVRQLEALHLHLLWNKPCGPTPLANSCNEPCVRQCQDSTVVIEPSPVVVTLPGPILSSFPQNTAVGSSTSAAVGSILSSAGVPISSGGFGLSGLSGLGSRYCSTRCLPC
ncbi:feather keratin 1-like [Chroicocephalus ridibundus]|uniref:feather keratin 1-like n=1 Tax=Chroicocephalus ridibundus TaxID=1192867 RepID=UPI002FDC81A7